MTEKVKKEVEEIIKEYKSQVSVSYIRAFEDQKFESQAFWQSISQFQILSEDFIREFQDKVWWYAISWHQKLLEDFIREFKDEINWYQIFLHQKLSEGFIREITENLKDDKKFYYEENLRCLLRNKNIPNQIRKEINNYGKILPPRGPIKLFSFSDRAEMLDL